MAFIGDPGDQDQGGFAGFNPQELARRMAQRQIGMPAPANTVPAAPPQPQPQPAATPPGRMLTPQPDAPGPGKMAPAPQMPGPGPKQQIYEADKAPQLHGWKNVLDIAGKILAPRIEAAIPGTPGNYQQRIGQEAEASKQEQEGTERQYGIGKTVAETADVQSQTDQRAADAELARARANAAPKEPAATAARPESIDQEYSDAVMDAQNRGVDPATDSKVQQVLTAAHALKPVDKPAPQGNEEERAISDYMAAKKLPDTPANRNTARQALKAQDRVPREASEEERSVADYLSANKLPNTPANRLKAQTDLAAGKATATEEAKSAGVTKQLRDDGVQQLAKMKALASTNTDPANYEFLMNFIAATYAGMKGARINRAEIERAAITRSLPDTLQHSYDQFVNRRILTPQQKTEMLDAIGKVVGTYAAPSGGGAAGPANDPLGIR